MNVAGLLERSARIYADRPALTAGDRTWTYRALDAATARLAGGFARLGLAPGDRIGLHLPNGAEFVLAYYAAQKAGLVPLSLNVTYTKDEIAYIVGDASPVAVVTADALADNLPAAADMLSVRHVLDAAELDRLHGTPLRALDRDREETAAILYTSATTGRPKGVMLTQSNLVSNAYATVHHLRITRDDRGLCALPMFHCFGQNAIMNALVTAGALLVLHERFVPDRFVDALAQHRITILYAVPTMYILFLARPQPLDLASVRLCFSAAAILPADVERRWHETYGHAIHQGYGLTETSPFASYNHDVCVRSGSVGTPIENVEMKIVGADGRELADGEPGEIVIKGPNVMKGYFGNPQATAEAIRDGWFHSGDIGYRDDDGYFYIVDRVKDMINVAGFKVFPREVEEVLFRHAGVKEAAVIGMPDPVRGEAVKAYVVLTGPGAASAAELQSLCRAAIAAYKIPEAIEFIDALPKNPTGKILKKDLRRRDTGSAKL
jgi:long-chain acyl-CoA synthetase